MAALYFNVFVAVLQVFQTLSFLQPLAPTQSEPPFLVAQLLVLATFIALGVGAVKRFHPDMTAPAGARPDQPIGGHDPPISL